MPYSQRDPSVAYSKQIEAKVAEQKRERSCLKCLSVFMSFGPQNRICPCCSMKTSSVCVSMSESKYSISAPWAS